MRTICHIVDCGRKELATGLCGKHYQRMAARGTTDEAKRPSPLERFNSMVIKTDDCWLWSGAKNDDGRAISSLDGRNILAYRMAWILFRGPIPDGLLVCHKCDNGGCVNPDHLFVGTHKDNQRDAWTKGRKKPPGLKGQDHGSAKLCDMDVFEIRKKLTDGMTKSAIAAQYNVWPQSITNIATGKTWKHLT